MKNSGKILIFTLLLLTLSSVMVIGTFAAGLQSITDLEMTDYSKIYFKGETNKDFTKYDISETMVFSMSLYAEDLQITAPYFYYTLRGDDGASSSGYTVPDENGFATIKTSVSTKGAVRLVVQPCNASREVLTAGNITKFEGGAIADAANIQPTVSEPLDFDEFWADQLSMLDGCAPDLFYLEQIESTNSNYNAYIVKVNCIGDTSAVSTGATWTAGVLSVPKNASEGSLGFNLLYYGYGVKTAEQSHNANYITFSVCAHSIEQLMEAAYYEDTAALGLTNYGFSAEKNELPETSYFRGMLLRDVQAVRFLKKYFGSEGGETTFNEIDISSWKGLWNGKDIYTRGSSQGGFQAISVAALVPEVTKIYATVPWFADVAGNTSSIRISSTFRPTYANGLRYFDTAFMAKRVKAQIINITAGTGDTLCPMYAIQSIYNNLNANVSMIFRQGMTHSNTKTYPIEFTQSKSKGEMIYFGKDAFLVSDEYSEVIQNVWTTLTGMEALCFDDSVEFASSEADKRIKLEFLSVKNLTDSETVVAAKEEILNTITALDLDAYAFYIYDLGKLQNKTKAVLEMASEPESKVYLIGIGENPSALNVSTALEQLSGAIYKNYISSENSVMVIDENGDLWTDFAVTNNLNTFEAYPVYTPYYDIKNNTVKTTFSFPDSEGTEYGILTVKVNDTQTEIRVYSKETVTYYGDGWLIYDGVLYISHMEDAQMSWNNHTSYVNRVDISEGIKELASGALSLKIGTVVSLPYSIENIDSNAFSGSTDIIIEGYDGSAANDFAETNSIAYVSLGTAGKCGYGVYWKYKDGTLTIFGTGSLLESGVSAYNKHAESAWYEYYPEITKVIIGENVKTISSHDFHQMTNLETVEITPNLKVLEQGAFMTCPKLSTVYIKGNEPIVGTLDFRYVTSIGTYCFDQGKAAKKYILSGLEGIIGKETFKANTKLTAITIPQGVSAIEAEAFDTCLALKELTVLGMNTEISEYAFANNTSSTAKNYIKNIKIIAYSGSEAQKFAIDNGLVFRNIETEKEIDYSVLPDISFLTFKGYEVRMDSYNGLRSKFISDLSKIDLLEDKGFEIVEYGTLLASSAKLQNKGDELTVSGKNGEYSTLTYVVMMTIVENGIPIKKHSIDRENNLLTYYCTVVNFKENNYNDDVTIRGYAVVSDGSGNEFIFYSECEKEEYRSVSLATVCDALAKEGTVTIENCISYSDIMRFRGKVDDFEEGDNEMEEDDIFG